jgi:peptide-methionine (R)-S-oxide reductase
MPSSDEPVGRLNKSRDEWRKLLPPDQFTILFEGATERPFSHRLNDEKRPGTFLCAACGLALFRSDAKFDSGTGWPSFTQAIPSHVDNKTDFKLILPRTEYHCTRYGGHQGHVFNDGPQPTSQRWCNNGLALSFIPEGDPLPP